MFKQNDQFKPLEPRIVLGIAAHPDDLEFGVAGSIAKWVNAGAEAYYLILTNGNKGSEDRSLSSDQLRDLRRDEQRAAGRALGLKDVFFLDYEDGALEITQDLKRDIVRVIRQVKPDVVLTMDPTFVYDECRGFINHPDHRAAGQATLDAVFPLARDHLSFPELLTDEGLEPHKTPSVLLTNFKSQNFYIDISDTIDIKLDALREHASQIADLEFTLGYVKRWAVSAGERIGVDYAEGFVRIDIA